MPLNSNYDVIKEPRGFIKCLEIFLAIFAFSCATGFRGSFHINQKYGSSASHPVKGSFKYPFDGSIFVNMKSNVSGAESKDVAISIDERSSTEFFVVIGVFCFLYSLGVLCYYVFFENPAAKDQASTATLTPPVIDFVAAGLWAFFWFASACAQAAAVNSIENATDAKSLSKSLTLCKSPFSCEVITSTKYATLTISIILGFLNVFVWAGNMWFLWKETPWHNRAASSPATVAQPQHQQTPQAAAI